MFISVGGQFNNSPVKPPLGTLENLPHDNYQPFLPQVQFFDKIKKDWIKYYSKIETGKSITQNDGNTTG
jgi:hypothetical protein